MNETLMNRMTWVEYRDRVQNDGATVFLPVGATEQHGPHLPLGTDHILAGAVAQNVAARVQGIVAPPLAYGYKSQPKCGGGQHFCGTTSLDAQTLNTIFPDGFPGYALKHAAVLETSMMLHYHPDLVHLDRIPDDGPTQFPPYDMYPPHTHLVPASGVLSSAKAATANKGTLMVEELTDLTDLIAAAVRKEFT